VGLRAWASRRFRKPAETGRALAPRAAKYMNLYDVNNVERPIYNYTGYADQAYSGNAAVFAVAQKRANVFSEATFKFRALRDKHLFGGQDLFKLENPWPDGSTGDLLARMIQDADTAGNAYIVDHGDRLERLRPDWVTIVSTVVTDELSGDQIREVIGFAYDPTGDLSLRATFYPVEQVAHWAPIPDPLSNFRGMSWMTPIIREVDADVRMSAFRDAFFTNAATANIIVKYQQKLTPDKVSDLREQIAAKHTGARTAFGTMLFDEGGDPMVVGSNMEGAAFDALAAAGETRIAAAAGVPPIVAGLAQGIESAVVGLYESAVRAFIDLTMRPLWRSACSALEKLVDVPGGAQLWYDTTDVSALAQGEKDMALSFKELGAAANQLVMAGFEPDSIIAALSAGDVSLLKHSGLTSVQMMPPGETPPPPATDSKIPMDATPPTEGADNAANK